MKCFWVYLLSNKCDSALYIGVSNNLERRLSEHREGKADSYSRRYKTTKLIYQEAYDDINAALARERQLKGWNRQRKRDLVSSVNPKWQDLSLDWYVDKDPSLRSG